MPNLRPQFCIDYEPLLFVETQLLVAYLLFISVPLTGMEKCRFVRCRFSRQGPPVLYVIVHKRAEASFLAAYGQERPDGPWVMLKRVKVENGPNASLNISKTGRYLALGQAEGGLRVRAWGPRAPLNGTGGHRRLWGGEQEAASISVVWMREAASTGALRRYWPCLL
jgi:hypothetical protein